MRPTLIGSGVGILIGLATVIAIVVSSDQAPILTFTHVERVVIGRASYSSAAHDRISAPVRLVLPSIRIDSPVIAVATEPDGSIATPCRPTGRYTPCAVSTTAWFNQSVRPGEHGDAVIDGHVDWYASSGHGNVPAVFAHLDRAQIGQTVAIADERGIIRHFVIDKITSLPYPQEPRDFLARSGPASVTLVTCQGLYVSKTEGFDHRLYVHAVLISAAAKLGSAT